jgi:hypothetical protein
VKHCVKVENQKDPPTMPSPSESSGLLTLPNASERGSD